MLFTYLLLSAGAVVMVIPFVWMILTSLKPATELVQFSFLPQNPTLANYADVARDDYFHVIFARTFGMAILVTAICIAIGVPEAYVLSRL